MSSHPDTAAADKDIVLSVRNLTKAYGGVAAVSSLDLDVKSGEIFGFLGPNGAGKTTLIKSVLGLTTPDQGAIEVFGKSIFSHRREIMRDVGAVVEAPCLFPDFTAFENLRYITRLSAEIPVQKLKDTLDLVGLANAGKKRVGAFSYGMKQRLGIAQALLPANKLIFLDEPTNGLDPHGIVGVRNLIRKLRCELGITIFLSSHLLSEVQQVCDRVAIIDRGVKICESHVKDLLSGRELVEIVARDPKDFAKFAKKEHIEIVKEGRSQKFENTVFMVKGCVEDVPGYARRLSAANIDIFHISIHQPTLEEIFVELTGKDVGASGSDRF
ncbi:MAG: ABC transporter ATP-binding protein [Victivallales bacterium]|nr:ABC transporter ATP-binding protein [Victivallales bacterium]